MSLPYYVYDLIDPRDGQVFCVGAGNGQRDRASGHVKAKVSSGKKRVLRSLRVEGIEPEMRLIKSFATKAEAVMFWLERERRFNIVSEGGEETTVSRPPNGLNRVVNQRYVPERTEDGAGNMRVDDEPKPVRAVPVLTTGEPFVEPPWPVKPADPPLDDDIDWELLLEGCDVEDAAD